MPGIDLQFGYNLLNIAHHDMSSGETNLLFDHPVLVKSIYYPSFEQDSLNNKPISRDYFMVSAYDEDTNNDTLINKFDLRRFYLFDKTCRQRTQLIPPDYSVFRSQYDKLNDAMFVFAYHDANGDGSSGEREPIEVFWFSLKTPGPAKKAY
jgi:hypothetical protein